MRDLIRKTLELPTALRVAADRESMLRYLRPDGQQVRVRELDGHGIHLRPGTSDRFVLRLALRGRSHLPPIPEPLLIWDLGANIGVTVAHMAHLLPNVRIVGVELDPANFRQAVRNIRPWSDRCEMINAAVWVEDGTVAFRRIAGHEDGVRIAERGASVPAISLNTLLQRTGPPDYVKMDVEGTEVALLTQRTEWAAAVGSIKVEIHGGYGVDECARDLRVLGFEVSNLPQPWWPLDRGRPCCVGIRYE